MPSALPDGGPAPADGSLPGSALAQLGRAGFGVYVHVPFCASRCGYCDFNTYTPTELGSSVGPALVEAYPDLVLAELELAGRVLGGERALAAPELRDESALAAREFRGESALAAPVQSVFFGGGTPTLLAPAQLGRILAGIDAILGLAADAEVTIEANPESVDPQRLELLRAAGFNRISLGMQSAATHVLAVLDRRHTPGRAVAAAKQAREAGFDRVNLDLIYATPGETPADFDASLQAAIDAGVDHISAYSLIVEEGTRLAARIRRGELADVDDDVAADRYLAAERLLSRAGFAWYEVSNWSRSPAQRCRHNQLYWRSGDWWGLGPGAHSHVGGVRWWNVKHPATYAGRLRQGGSPALAREILTDQQRAVEQIMLALRCVDGLGLSALTGSGLTGAAQAVADGLLDASCYAEGSAVLTLRGRLLADGVIRSLVPDEG